MVNYALRKEYLFQKTDNHWLQYVNLVNSFTPFAIVLGIVILTSIMASIEDETSAWKQLIALPVLKRQVYLSKFTVISCLLLISSIVRSEEHTYELQSRFDLVCHLTSSLFPYTTLFRSNMLTLSTLLHRLLLC